MTRKAGKLILKLLLVFIMIFLGNELVHAQDNINAHHGGKSYGSDGYADSLNLGLINNDTMKGSPRRTCMLTIGQTHIHIEYGSPGVKGRVIWGGLVPYDEVWVTGAHKATTISINKDIKIGEKKLPAGSYGLFTIPGINSWTVIFNKNSDQHLADDYQQAKDVLRLIVKPLAHAMTQRLTYAMEQKNVKQGNIIISWENIAIQLPFETN
jgi:hypothetical protein